MPDITEYNVRAGTTIVASLTFRKCRLLSNVTLPEGLLTIGDAAFSLCTSLRQIQIPASVERIGVAAFCKSGLVAIQFLGIPKVIEADAFESCWQLKEIVVPVGSRDIFIGKFGLPKDKVVEGMGNVHNMKQITESPPEPPKVNHDVQKAIPLQRFSYNARYFYWSVGDEVNLRNVFSLFIFVKSVIARTLKQEIVYELPADTASFARKYQDKYASRPPRIFIFVCDDSKTARVFDEVKLVRVNTNTIMVSSLLKRNL